MAKFRDYAPFNNFLVGLQYPSYSYFANARVGGDKKGRWPSRLNLSQTIVKLEPESAA